MKGFKGEIGFFKNTRASIQVLKINDSMTIDDWAEAGYIYLGAKIAVDVEFKDTRAQEIELLEKRIADERAESQRRISIMQGQIQDLQALGQPA